MAEFVNDDDDLLTFALHRNGYGLCGECERYDNTYPHAWFCAAGQLSGAVMPDDFCSNFAKREEDGDD